MENFEMPELIDYNDAIKLCARLNHDYDKDYWYEIDRNRKFLREYLLWVDKTNSLEDCHNASDLFIDLWNKKENFAYSIVLKETNKAIGSIDIHNINLKNNCADIGYWLAEEYNGKGFMSKAVKMIEKEAFARGMHRLTICVQAGNTPLLALPSEIIIF